MKQILIIIFFIGVLVGCRGKSPTETGTYTGIVTLDNDSAFIEVHCECGNHFRVNRKANSMRVSSIYENSGTGTPDRTIEANPPQH